MACLKPMEPTATDTINTSGEFFFQIKWDGIRLIAERFQGRVELYTRTGRIRTSHYPELVAELSEFRATDFLLDGELIALGSAGLPDFQRILKRDMAKQTRTDIAVGYMVFDCLRYSEKELFQRPIEERQEVLAHLVHGGSQQVISLCENYDDGNKLFRHMDELGMEGIVAKRRNSVYQPGRKTMFWQKTKCWREITASVLGVNYRDGQPVSIAVGQNVAGEIKVIGAVATGLNAQDWTYIRGCVDPTKPVRDRGMVPLSSQLQVHLRFLEWTNDGQLRAPTVLRVSRQV